MKKQLCMLICIFILITCAHAQKNILASTLKPLIGFWNDSKSKECRYAFFENFAVYDHDFWEYQSLSSQKNKTEITLKKGAETLILKVIFSSKADSLCTIASPSNEKHTYIRYSKAPDFTTENHQDTFVDNGYKEDSVTIIGYLRHVNKRKTLQISVPSYLSGENDVYIAHVDSLGRFRISIPLINTTEASIGNREDGIDVYTVLEAGETFFFFYDYENKEARFMGGNSRFKQELVNYDQYLSSNPERYSRSLSYDTKMEHDNYLLEHQKIYAENKTFFEAYAARHPSLSHKFRTYQQNALLMRHASSLMQRCFKLRRNFNKEQFSPTFRKYLSQLYRQIPQPYTLYGDIAYFLSNYCDYYNNVGAANITTSTIEILRYADKKKEYILTEQQKADLIGYEHFISNNEMGRDFKVDSLEIEAVIAPYKEQSERASLLLKDSAVVKLVRKYVPILPQMAEMSRINSEMVCFDSIVVPSALKELIVTSIFYRQFYQHQTALLTNSIEYFKKLVSNETFRKIVFKQQEEFMRLAQQNVEYEESFKNTDHLKDIKDGEQLFKALIAPYKGKVIYLDFWGTWCSPCKEEMKHAPAIKEVFKGKDMIFMYLANNSPEDSWKNVIKENHLTGIDVVHYNLPSEQQKLVENWLSVQYFPTFMLVDKEGNLVEKKAPSPSYREEVLHRITMLLAQ